MGYNLPIRNSRNGSNSNEVPSLFSDHTPITMKNNSPDNNNLVVKNNKYYVSRKLNQATSPKNSPQMAYSSDRDLISVGSFQSPKQSLQTDNSEAMMYDSASRTDQENKAFKRKPLSGRPQNLRTSPDLFENQEQIPVERIPLATKNFNRGNESSKNQPDNCKIFNIGNSVNCYSL